MARPTATFTLTGIRLGHDWGMAETGTATAYPIIPWPQRHECVSMDLRFPRCGDVTDQASGPQGAPDGLTHAAGGVTAPWPPHLSTTPAGSGHSNTGARPGAKAGLPTAVPPGVGVESNGTRVGTAGPLPCRGHFAAKAGRRAPSGDAA